MTIAVGGADPDGGLASDLDLRIVRYFVAVAEHANFGRAAQALRLAQPSLSRQIQRLERQLGVQLFVRGPSGSTLTDAGDAFLPHARSLLATARRGAAAARAVDGSDGFTIGYLGGLGVTDAVRALHSLHPEARIRTRELPDVGAAAALRSGEVDALLARMPLSLDGIRTRTLLEEPRLLLVSSGHPLAGRESVSAEDFELDLRVSCGATDHEWTSFWRLDPASGSPAPLAAARVATFRDKLELVAMGEAIAVVSAGDSRLVERPDLCTVRIRGIEPSRIVTAIRSSEEDALASDFLGLGPTAFGLETSLNEAIDATRGL